jgi:uncharacterized membrane protein
MNRKQKVLTVIALMIFVVIGALHRLNYGHHFVDGGVRHGWWLVPHPNAAILPDVTTPWIILGVIYVGVFFLLADRKPTPSAPDDREEAPLSTRTGPTTLFKSGVSRHWKALLGCGVVTLIVFFYSLRYQSSWPLLIWVILVACLFPVAFLAWRDKK